ncbi:MAG: spore coat protein CotJB [Clostridiales bacterium]|jgi:spore coat protein JB|nr:spore coat protein CotJB [Clostridiales bacterium]
MLLKKIMELDFMSIDLQLYLDTHPNDIRVLKKYNEVVEESNMLKKEYEKEFGPLVSFRNTQDAAEKWSDEPWPSQRRMNLRIFKEMR